MARTSDVRKTADADALFWKFIMSDAEDEAQTPETLRAKLREYEDNLADVEDALRDDPSDAEMREMKDSLVEVIGITRDVLETTLSALEAANANDGDERETTVEVATATPTSLARTFVGRDVLVGDAERRGRCVRVREDGKLDVYVGETHERVVVDVTEVKIDFGDRGRSAAAAAAAAAPREVYKGVPEPKRFVEHTMKTEYTRKEAPRNLLIKPTDDAVTMEAKRKKLKAFKRRQRQQEVAAEHNAKASSWQNFQAKKRKTTGIQKGSIFALPEDLSVAKGVGFGGAARGLTHAPPKRKHNADFGGEDSGQE